MYNNNLYEARRNSHITQAELAEKLNMNTVVYGRYERGERDIPLSLAAQMAEILNVSLDYLACRSKSPLGLQADEDNMLVQKTLIEPAIKNATNEKETLLAYIEVLRKEQKKTNEQAESAVAQIMKIINEKYPENK